MKKGVDFVQYQACDDAFKDIKQYLANSIVLAAPLPGKPFILYARALNHSLGALLAQNNDEGKEIALYYFSRMLVGVEHNYLPMEKECLALTVDKLQHYILSNAVYLVLQINPLKVSVTKASSLSDRLVKWSIVLSQYDIRYTSTKAVKGQALVDFLDAHPILKDSKLNDEPPDEPSDLVDQASKSDEKERWGMNFDGATRTNELSELTSSVRIVFYSPERMYIPFSYSLLIMGLKLALEAKIYILDVYGNSQLIIRQMNFK